MMRVMHILPELEEGGVERHVLMLSGQQREEGHEVYVVSAGGKLVSQLAKEVSHIRLPVHIKNPLVGMYCAASSTNNMNLTTHNCSNICIRATISYC